MNRNLIAGILIIISVGIFFTVTDSKYQKVKAIRAQNDQYLEAIEKSKELLKKRDTLAEAYSSIPAQDIERLNRMIPDSIDSVRLIIDMNAIGARLGLTMKNIRIGDVAKTVAPEYTPKAGTQQKPDSVNISFSVTTTYDKFLELLKELEKSLRILEISKFNFTANDQGTYDYTVELTTYWLRQ